MEEMKVEGNKRKIIPPFLILVLFLPSLFLLHPFLSPSSDHSPLCFFFLTFSLSSPNPFFYLYVSISPSPQCLLFFSLPSSLPLSLHPSKGSCWVSSVVQEKYCFVRNFVAKCKVSLYLRV